MLNTTTRRLSAAAFIAFVTALGAMRAGAGPALDATKSAFRLTPVSAGTRDAEADAVWRLGRSLFFDPRLSASGRTACATCHVVSHAWSDVLPRSVGDGGARLAFKAPTLLDVGRLGRLGWTGKFADTAAVTKFALTSPTNMNAKVPDLVARLRSDPSEVEAFRAAFGSADIDGRSIVQALATFVNSIEAVDAPFDKWIDGDEAAIGGEAKRGFAIFIGKGRCAECHKGPALTDGSFHDIGSSKDDLGRGALFKTSLKLQHAFKTPSLRGVAERAPYMHDGSRATLADVVDLYDRGGIDRPSRSDVIKPLHLSEVEKKALIAFLQTLSGSTRFAVAPASD